MAKAQPPSPPVLDEEKADAIVKQANKNYGPFKAKSCSATSQDPVTCRTLVFNISNSDK